MSCAKDGCARTQGGASFGTGTVSELRAHNVLEYYAAIKNCSWITERVCQEMVKERLPLTLSGGLDVILTFLYFSSFMNGFPV